MGDGSGPRRQPADGNDRVPTEGVGRCPGRNQHRVVRLHDLRGRGGPGVQRALLPRLQPARRDARRVRDVLGRVPGPAARWPAVRPLRRPGGSQVDARGDPAAHGSGHLRYGTAAHVRAGGCVGTGPAGPAPGPAGHRPRR
jgi:hypothetical protein